MTIPTLTGCDHTVYFNPHFRKGSDDRWMICWRQQRISIHTSAREVTYGGIRNRSTKRISIHTSAREVTGLTAQQAMDYIISIHTSAREVTTLAKGDVQDTEFQSTLPQGK